MHDKFRTRFGLWLPCLAGLMLQSGTAMAHPEGHGLSGFAAGFAHPLTGIDHALAMIAVGLWAVQLGRKAMWALPALFPLAMTGGVLLAYAGVPLPAIEPVIALSVVVIGGAVAMSLRLPVFASALLVAAFAVFHGYAHFVEAPVAAVVDYVPGFLAATVCLHIAGLMLGCWTRGVLHDRVMRIGGSMIAATGVALLVI